MGSFKNKKSRSKAGNYGGRLAGKFSQLNEQEKWEYFNDAVHKHRYVTERPRDSSNVNDLCYSSSSSESEDESPSVRRPPLNLVAMSPNKLSVDGISQLREEETKTLQRDPLGG